MKYNLFQTRVESEGSAPKHPMHSGWLTKRCFRCPRRGSENVFGSLDYKYFFLNLETSRAGKKYF